MAALALVDFFAAVFVFAPVLAVDFAVLLLADLLAVLLFAVDFFAAVFFAGAFAALGLATEKIRPFRNWMEPFPEPRVCG